MIPTLTESILGAILAFAPSHPDTLRADRWLAIGPFPSGSREALVDPIWPLDPAEIESPVPRDSMPSPMAPGGWVHWIPVESKGSNVPLAYEGVDWDALTSQWGAAGVASVGLLYGTIALPAAGAYRIDAVGIGTLYLDGERYLGNPYSTGSVFESAAVLSAGEHRVLLRVTGMGPRTVAFHLLPERGPVFVNAHDLTLPDLVQGEALDGWGAAAVVNCTDRVLRGAVLRFGDGQQIQSISMTIPPLEPLAILKVPFVVRTLSPLASVGPCAERIEIHSGEEVCSVPCTLQVREPQARRRNTFLSRQDGSVQMYGVLPPSSAGTERPALILSLHGASVVVEGQVASYAPKDWAYVVAPTNTRPFGFDWQDWGARNALETLSDALERYPCDPDRILLTGHSMGGHGAWYVGVSNPGLFAAVAPSAGWGSFETYLPFTMRRDTILAPPRALAIWRRAIVPDNPYLFLRNLRSTPIFVLQGGKDDNVPPMHARMLSQAARNEGASVIYREVPGMGHWWDDPNTPGVDCVDLPELMDFLKGCRRDPHPREVSLRTADLGTCNRNRWLAVEKALRPFDMIRVEARVLAGDANEDPEIEITTSGAVGIAVDPLGLIRPGRITIHIDGVNLRTSWREGEIHLLRAPGGEWRIVRSGDSSPARRAPIKGPYFEPFVLVYGTAGNGAEVAAMRRAAVLDAQAWYQRADGYAPVLPDTEVTAETIQGRNMILYALPGANRILSRIAERLPIRVTREEVKVGRNACRGEPLAARFAYPNPLAEGRLIEVVAGTDLEGFRLAAASNPCYSGSGYPDFVVFGADARKSGWGAMRAAGFFDDSGGIPGDGSEAYLP